MALVVEISVRAEFAVVLMTFTLEYHAIFMAKYNPTKTLQHKLMPIINGFSNFNYVLKQIDVHKMVCTCSCASSDLF